MVDVPVSPQQKLRERRDNAIRDGKAFHENNERQAIDMAIGRIVLGRVENPEIIPEDPRNTTLWDELDANTSGLLEERAKAREAAGSDNAVILARLNELEEENQRQREQIKELMGMPKDARTSGATPEPAPAGSEVTQDGAPSDSWTMMQLKQYAAERQIPVLPALTKKSDVLGVILAAERERREAVNGVDDFEPPSLTVVPPSGDDDGDSPFE